MTIKLHRKVTIWTVETLPESLNTEELISRLNAGEDVEDLMNEYNVYEFPEYENESLHDTECILHPEENAGYSTLELQVEGSIVWQNGKELES